MFEFSELQSISVPFLRGLLGGQSPPNERSSPPNSSGAARNFQRRGPKTFQVEFAF